MNLFKNKALPVLFIAVLSIFSSGCKSGKIEFVLGPNYIAPITEDHSTFVITTDGTRTEGEKFSERKPGKIHLDDKSFRHKDVKIMQRWGQYLVNHRGSFIKLIIKGKINIYQSDDITSASGQLIYLYYYQIGEGGEIKTLSKFNELVELTTDCPQVYNKLNRPYDEIRDEYRKDDLYVFNLICLYNRICGK